jgi:hypothetical protein
MRLRQQNGNNFLFKLETPSLASKFLRRLDLHFFPRPPQ